MSTRKTPRTTTRSIREVVGLAGPVVIAELGWMAMQVVDTLLVRHLGAEAIGAVGVGGAVFTAVAVLGTGLFMGLDPLVAQAVGAGRGDEAKRWLRQGLLVALALSGPLMALSSAGSWVLTLAGVHPSVRALAVPYLQTLMWGLPALLLYAAARRYLQAWGQVRPVMIALVSANVVNAVADVVLINGLWGAPRLGVVGAGWATAISRAYMAALLLAAIWLHGKETPAAGHIGWRFEPERVRQLLRLGLPAALQVTLEVGSFSLATTLAGRLEPAALAAHHIALNLWSLTFMVPLGIASAAAVLVGHAVGRRDAAGAQDAGWQSLRVGGGFMTLAGLVFLAAPEVLMRLFTSDATVVSIGRTLLAICAAFQLFDGLQVVATGALRGIGDTRGPMVSNFAGLWCIGLPLGYILAFVVDWGIVGLWIGLSVGLLVIGATLLWRWQRLSSRLDFAREIVREHAC